MPIRRSSAWASPEPRYAGRIETVIAHSDDGSPATPFVSAQSSPRGSGMPSQRTGTVQACATVVLPSSAQSWKSG